MCGITGILNPNGIRREDDQAVKRMILSLLHRGPDETGMYLDHSAAIGQARLSILDLAGGSQPMTNEDSTLWIVFNGEIFNYPELRESLIKGGHRFRTNSDTEVLIHLYEDKKEKCLDDLNGQFVFAIWDTKNEELFLARDRAGIVPLFYTLQENGKFIFGSEIKAIFSEGTVKREINYRALKQIFTLWTTLPGQTFFSNISELPPGTWMKVKGRNLTQHKYWDLRFRDTEPELNYNLQNVAEQAKEILLDAVRIRLRADVPVGCYLSGGLDSSAITSLISRNFNNELRTFGITFEENDFNERYYQQLMVSYLKVNHTEQHVTNKDISEFFSAAVYNMEKPVLRSAPVPLYMLSRKVKEEGYKVVLSGEGSDEIFGGYNIFKEALIRKFWSMYPVSTSRHLLLSRLYPYVFKDKRLQSSITEFFKTGIDDPDNPFFSHQIRWKNTSKILNFLSPQLAEQLKDYDPAEEMHNFIPQGFEDWSVLGKAQYLEFILFMSGYLLSSQGDRMAMSHSVELRVPFLDHRLIEYMACIPHSMKIRGLNEKYILKKMFTKQLPSAILNRPKNPYRAPINYLFMISAEKNNELVSPDNISAAGLFDPSKVKLLVKKLNNTTVGEVDNMAAAGILSSQAVYDRFIKNFEIPEPILYIDHYFDFRKELEKSL